MQRYYRQYSDRRPASGNTEPQRFQITPADWNRMPIRSPRLDAFTNLIVLNHGDVALQDFHDLLLRRLELIASLNPFVVNDPPSGQPLTTEPSLVAGVLSNGELLPFPLDRITSGCGFGGPTGTGKTTAAEFMIVQLVQSGATVIVFDMKRRWRRLLNYMPLAGRVVVSFMDKGAWSLWEQIPGRDRREAANAMCSLLAQVFFRRGSERILRDIIDDLMAVCPPNVSPTPQMVIDRLEAFAAKNIREREYAASIVWMLKDIVNYLGETFDYTHSDYPQRLFDKKGHLIVLEDPGLPPTHFNFIVCLYIDWICRCRRHNPDMRTHDIIFIIEDCTAILDSARDAETPGGIALLPQYANISRELRVVVVPIFHSLRQLSPKFLVNIESLFMCGIRGEDIDFAQHVLGLSVAQAQFMRTNPRGMMCAMIPSVWPLPVLLSFPQVMEA